jgi:DNA replication licensing factor MCM3
VRPKVVRSVHYCPNTDKTVERKYTDLTSYAPMPRSAAYPREVILYFQHFQLSSTFAIKDENKNPLETEFGLSVYKDHQTFSIQELPESAPAGQLPRSVDVVADYDLADR